MRKYNKQLNTYFIRYEVIFIKIMKGNTIKKFRVRSWIKARNEEMKHEFKSNY